MMRGTRKSRLISDGRGHREHANDFLLSCRVPLTHDIPEDLGLVSRSMRLVSMLGVLRTH